MNAPIRIPLPGQGRCAAPADWRIRYYGRLVISQPIEVTIRAFAAADQNAVRRLIVDGLGARWGQVDERLNPDLDDIAATYVDGLTLTAWDGDHLVGTGTLAPRSGGRAEVLRMSTAADYRRRGIATRILRDLLAEARRRGFHTVVLETAAHWSDARVFYERNGFIFDYEEDGEFCRDAYYRLSLRE